MLNRLRFSAMQRANKGPRLLQVLRRFAGARRGNVATTFALATIPILAFIGGAVDYSRANSVKADLQGALDSAALMLSKEAATDTNNQLQANALAYVTANYNRPGTTIGSVGVSYTTSGGSQVTLSGSANVPTDFMQILGVNSVTVNATSTVKWGMTRLRVALVLDNTGSMADSGKIGALKTATNNLLTQLKNAAVKDGDVYVSIIPFVKDVNIDSSNWNSNYIYWGTSAQDPSLTDNNSWDATNGSCSAGNYYSTRSQCVAKSTCSISGYSSQSSCTSAGSCSNSGQTTQSSCTGSKACSKSQYTSHSSCTNGGGTWAHGTWTSGVWNAATWTPSNHNTWNGCVMDRGYSTTPDTVNNYDTNVASTSVSVNSSLYPAEQYSTCPQAAMGLNYNWSTMTTLVNNMSPNGNTNQAIGLQLGWMSLAGGGPFTVPAMDPNYTYTQVIILLTDGLNTQDRWYSSQSSIDTRQQMTCNNIKAAGVTLYTIQVNTGGDPTSTLLQNCASDSSKFFLLTSSNQIVTTFNSIGTNLSNLYVSK
jgi:Flp pilus assembly protein TadG